MLAGVLLPAVNVRKPPDPLLLYGLLAQSCSRGRMALWTCAVCRRP
jgi:hypothetical protein